MPTYLVDCPFISVVIFGASGDLAKKKTYPALYNLYYNEFLSSSNTSIIGYARSDLEKNVFIDRVTQNIKYKDQKSKENFQKLLHYRHGKYDDIDDLKKLNEYLCQIEDNFKKTQSSVSKSEKGIRIFYLALPPSVFVQVSQNIKKFLSVSNQKHSFDIRVVIEKPFGKDLETYRNLSMELCNLYSEEDIFRIDHYLGKEMMKNFIILRFGNTFFSSLWNKSSIANVQITFKETIGVEGRGAYFDEFGIIRDIMQNHLLQIFSIVAMDQPKGLDAQSIRDEKVKVLNSVKPIDPSNVIIGQYISSEDGSMKAYRDDPTVHPESMTATFAAAVLFIDSDTWEGVPFIMKCGKAMNEQKTEVRIQFKDIQNSLFPREDIARNELVIRVSPSELVYLKLMLKEPGLEFKSVISELDLTYHSRYENIRIPDAYESLLLDVLRNDHANFVRNDELESAWKIFTPILDMIEKKDCIPLEDYPAKSRGPKNMEKLLDKYGFVRSEKTYDWKPPQK